jgi:FKBP-type peptidyl-prolyl cis-trans isomerase
MKGAPVKRLSIFVIFGLLILINANCGQQDKGTETVSLETNQDSVSYIIGMDMARSLMTIKDEVNLDVLFSGMKDQLNEKPLLVTDQEARKIMREFSARIQKNQEEAKQKSAQDNLEEGKKFLEQNKKLKGVVTTNSGLQYMVLEKGDGPKPTAQDRVKVHYRGTLIDGTVFDSSYDRGEPVIFPVDGVIKGWTEALILMNVGSKYKLFVPSELAYDQRGAGQKIGPNQVLIFEVELLGIEN